MSLRLYRIHYTVRKFNNNSSYLSHQVIPHRQTYFPKHIHCCMFLAFTREALNSSPNRSHVTMDFICTGINNYGFTFAEYSFLSNETVHCLHTMRPRQNGRHFPDYLFKCIFLNDRLWISIKIPLKLVSKGPVNNIPGFGSDNGLVPTRRQAIIWTNDILTQICVTRPKGVNLAQIPIIKTRLFFNQIGLCSESVYNRW